MNSNGRLTRDRSLRTRRLSRVDRDSKDLAMVDQLTRRRAIHGIQMYSTSQDLVAIPLLGLHMHSSHKVVALFQTRASV
jgi:hypothetical protein